MSAEPPPQNTSGNFNNDNYINPNQPVDEQYLLENFLSFPLAQGQETLLSTVISGTLTTQDIATFSDITNFNAVATFNADVEINENITINQNNTQSNSATISIPSTFNNTIDCNNSVTIGDTSKIVFQDFMTVGETLTQQIDTADSNRYKWISSISNEMLFKLGNAFNFYKECTINNSTIPANDNSTYVPTTAWVNQFVANNPPSLTNYAQLNTSTSQTFTGAINFSNASVTYQNNQIATINQIPNVSNFVKLDNNGVNQTLTGALTAPTFNLGSYGSLNLATYEMYLTNTAPSGDLIFKVASGGSFVNKINNVTLTTLTSSGLTTNYTIPSNSNNNTVPNTAWVNSAIAGSSPVLTGYAKLDNNGVNQSFVSPITFQGTNSSSGTSAPFIVSNTSSGEYFSLFVDPNPNYDMTLYSNQTTNSGLTVRNATNSFTINPVSNNTAFFANPISTNDILTVNNSISCQSASYQSAQSFPQPSTNILATLAYVNNLGGVLTNLAYTVYNPNPTFYVITYLQPDTPFYKYTGASTIVYNAQPNIQSFTIRNPSGSALAFQSNIDFTSLPNTPTNVNLYVIQYNNTTKAQTNIRLTYNATAGNYTFNTSVNATTTNTYYFNGSFNY